MTIPIPRLSTERARSAQASAPVCDAARELNAIIVFKGPGTVIAGGNEIWINATGGPALAQGGTGDVLSGLLGALVAQALAEKDLSTQVSGSQAVRHVIGETVAAGVWLHGRAADRIASRVGP